MQIGSCQKFLDMCKSNGIHTTVETCGAVPWRVIEQIRPLVDQFLFDLKGWGEEWHFENTGIGQAAQNQPLQ